MAATIFLPLARRARWDGEVLVGAADGAQLEDGGARLQGHAQDGVVEHRESEGGVAALFRVREDRVVHRAHAVGSPRASTSASMAR